MKKHTYTLFLTSVCALLLAGCQGNNLKEAQTTGDAPYVQISKTVDFESEPMTILSSYSEEGQNWIRMTYPDVNQRDVAIRLIGRQALDASFTTIGGKTLTREDFIGEKTLLVITKTGSSVTEDMADYLDDFKEKHPDITVFEFYPNDGAEQVKAFKKEFGNAYNTASIMAGDNSKEALAIAESYNASYLPMLVYIDETGTISYVSLGYRDEVYLEDAVETAFGSQKLYDYIQTSTSDESEATEDSE